MVAGRVLAGAAIKEVLNMLVRRALLLPGAAMRQSATARALTTRAFVASQIGAPSPWQSGAKDGSGGGRRARALRGAGQARALAFGVEPPASVVDEGTKVQMGGTMEKTLAAIRKQVLFPPWSQPRGNSMVSLVNSHTNATRIGWNLWNIDLRFAPGLPPGWTVSRSTEDLRGLGGGLVLLERILTVHVTGRGCLISLHMDKLLKKLM